MAVMRKRAEKLPAFSGLAGLETGERTTANFLQERRR